ncbi:MAG TPA: NfeD family protein, partial [Pirellulaceae bacterium]|nr:NfeD family protein [Pirellulaceae bacterium]
MLLVLGILVVLLEFIVPSGGVLGVTAATLLGAGVVVAFMHSLTAGTIALVALAITLPSLFVAFVNIWPSTPLGKRILLGPQSKQDVLPPEQIQTPYEKLVGRKGTAKTKMLPSGIVLIDGNPFDAVSDGFAIEAGDPVRVIDVRMNRLIIQPFDPADDLPTDFSDRDVLEK